MRYISFFEYSQPLMAWLGKKCLGDKRLNFIIVLFGAPLAANPKRSGLAIGFAVSLFISFVYYTLIRMSQSFGYSERLPPLLAAWAANILFAILGTILLVRAKK